MSYPDGGIGFRNPVIGGDGELVIEDIHSRNYVPGVAGWRIAKNGDAEFNSVDVRGELHVRQGNSKFDIVVDALLGPSALINPDTTEYDDGAIWAEDISPVGRLLIESPAKPTESSVLLTMESSGGAFPSFFEILCETMQVWPVTTFKSDVKVLGNLNVPFGFIGPDTVTFDRIPLVDDGVVTGPVWVADAWQNITLNAGFIHNATFPGFGFTPQFRRIVGATAPNDHMVELRGTVAKTAGAAFASGDIPFTLGGGERPSPERQFKPVSATSGGGSAQTIRLELNETNGNAIVTWSTAGYAPTWFCMDGVRIYRD